jgi:hypothetical protein
MPLVGFQPAIWAGEQPKTYALDRTATATGIISVYIFRKQGNLLHFYVSFFTKKIYFLIPSFHFKIRPTFLIKHALKFKYWPRCLQVCNWCSWVASLTPGTTAYSIHLVGGRLGPKASVTFQRWDKYLAPAWLGTLDCPTHSLVTTLTALTQLQLAHLLLCLWLHTAWLSGHPFGDTFPASTSNFYVCLQWYKHRNYTVSHYTLSSSRTVQFSVKMSKTNRNMSAGLRE